MNVENHCIYNLNFAYTRISTKDNVEIDFRGVLSYHTKDIDLLSSVTGGILELESINIFLYFQVQRNIDMILSDIGEDEIVNQRPIIVNRIKMIVRKELAEIGLEFIDFKQISLWSYGISSRGIAY